MANEGLDLFADGFSFLEVPRWHEGRLWVADMFAGHVVAFAADSAAKAVMTVPEVLAGFGWMPDGRLLAVTRSGRLLRQEATAVVELPSLLSGGTAPCNEMTIDGQGRAYIGLFGLAGGGLARVDPDDSARVVATDMLLPNGQALSADGFGDPVPGRAARVRERFSDLTGAHATVLDQVTDDARVQFSPADQAWVDLPVRGRVVLIGDAWHAATPSMAQGGSMAAEDALVLVQELAAGPDIDQALARYASRRRPRTAHVQETTAMRNGLAALPLEDRVGFVPRWAELSVASFAALVPVP